MHQVDFLFCVLGLGAFRDFPTNKSSGVCFVGKFSVLIFENPTKKRVWIGFCRKKLKYFFCECSFLEVFICYFPTKSSSICLFVGIYNFQVFYFPTNGYFLCYFVGKRVVPRGNVGRYGAGTLVIGILYCEFVKKNVPRSGGSVKDRSERWLE